MFLPLSGWMIVMPARRSYLLRPPFTAVRPSPNTSHAMPKRGDSVFQFTRFGCSANSRAGTQRPAAALCCGIDIVKRS